MKKITLVLAFLGFLAFSDAVCGETQKNARNETVVIVSYPEFDNDRLDSDLRAWLNKRIEGFLEKTDSVDYLWPEDESLTVEVQYKTHYPSENAVAVEFQTVWHVRHAAHPSTFLDCRSYLLGTGEALTPQNLFADPDKALRIIAGQAKAKVGEYLKRVSDERYVVEDLSLLDEKWFMDGSSPDWENYQTLIPLPEGVKVVFQQYQILPYVFGLVEYLVPVDDLREAGPNPQVWLK